MQNRYSIFYQSEKDRKNKERLEKINRLKDDLDQTHTTIAQNNNYYYRQRVMEATTLLSSINSFSSDLIGIVKSYTIEDQLESPYNSGLRQKCYELTQQIDDIEEGVTESSPRPRRFNPM